MKSHDVVLPEEHTFRLTRLSAVVNLAALVVVGGGLGFLAGRDFPIGGSPWEPVVRTLIAACFLICGLREGQSLFKPMPVAVRLDSVGMHLQWPDREVEWPWETIELGSGGYSSLELGPDGEARAFTILFPAGRERRLFYRLVMSHLAEPLGRREAALVAAGEPVRVPPQLCLMLVSLWVAFGGYIAIKSGLLIAISVHAYQYMSPASVPTFEAMLAFSLLIAIAAVMYAVRRNLRMGWFSLRFLSEGLEESWPGGRRFIPYGSIDRIQYHRQSGLAYRLILKMGKRTLRLGAGMTLFWGALQLLRERALAAQWEETER